MKTHGASGIAYRRKNNRDLNHKRGFLDKKIRKKSLTGPALGYCEKGTDGDESMIAVTAGAKKLFYVDGL